MDNQKQGEAVPIDISEEDIIEAMKASHGYLDITPGDFMEVYKVAYLMAVKRLLDTLTAQDIMVTPVQSLARDVELVDAAATLAGQKVSGAPVVDHEGKVIGVVSEKDFLKEMGFGTTPSFMQITNHCLNDRSCMINKLRRRTVADIMTSPAITAGPELTVRQISAFFAEKGINRLPIVSAEQHPIGIVTRTDLAYSYSLLGKGKKQ